MKKLYFGEILGTFALIFIGCTVAVLSGNLLTTALAFGTTVVVMSYTIGHLSGGHFNPVVSLAMAVKKKITWNDFLHYILAQFVGGIFGILAVYVITHDRNGLGSNQVSALSSSESISIFIGLFTEILVTFFFIFVILMVQSKQELEKFAGLIIGITLSLLILVAGPVTNASLNPIRSLAPALIEFGKPLEQLWIFILGPTVGSLLAVFVYNFVPQDES